MPSRTKDYDLDGETNRIPRARGHRAGLHQREREQSEKQNQEWSWEKWKPPYHSRERSWHCWGWWSFCTFPWPPQSMNGENEKKERCWSIQFCHLRSQRRLLWTRGRGTNTIEHDYRQISQKMYTCIAEATKQVFPVFWIPVRPLLICLWSFSDMESEF